MLVSYNRSQALFRDLRYTLWAHDPEGRVPAGPDGRADLSSHDGLYELYGTEITSDAVQFDKPMSPDAARGDHPGTAGSGQRAALQNPPTGDPHSRQSTSVHPYSLQQSSGRSRRYEMTFT